MIPKYGKVDRPAPYDSIKYAWCRHIAIIARINSKEIQSIPRCHTHWRNDETCSHGKLIIFYLSIWRLFFNLTEGQVRPAYVPIWNYVFFRSKDFIVWMHPELIMLYKYVVFSTAIVDRFSMNYRFIEPILQRSVWTRWQSQNWLQRATSWVTTNRTCLCGCERLWQFCHYG